MYVKNFAELREKKVRSVSISLTKHRPPFCCSCVPDHPPVTDGIKKSWTYFVIERINDDKSTKYHCKNGFSFLLYSEILSIYVSYNGL